MSEPAHSNQKATALAGREYTGRHTGKTSNVVRTSEIREEMNKLIEKRKKEALREPLISAPVHDFC
jgi:hypothetical protein